MQCRIRDPVVIQGACGISAVRADKGGSCLGWLLGAAAPEIRSGDAALTSVLLLERPLRVGGCFLCTATASLTPCWAPRSQSSGAASCLIIPGWGSILHSHSWAGAILALSQDSGSGALGWLCAGHALCLCGGYTGLLPPV